jgi:hypothetical protein
MSPAEVGENNGHSAAGNAKALHRPLLSSRLDVP